MDEFGDKFDENEHLTRKLPRFIEETAQYERQIVDVLDKDKCVRPPKSESGVYQLHLFAKNQIETGDHIVKMKIPSFKSGFSRHLYVILRNWHQSTLVFKTPEPQEFFSRDTINGTVPPGLHVLDVKEISDGKFYIAQSDVI